MKISLVQPDLIWEDKTENLRKLEILIRPLYGKSDIVILPEMFNTGFSMHPERLSELPGEETFIWMKRIAEIGDFGLGGSYMVNENGHFYNRFVFVSPENEFWHYDKRHLFSMAGENKYFTAGKERLVFLFKGVRISPYICYDLRFPVWSRNRNEFDLAIYAANWPTIRCEVWNNLLISRALENQCFVAGANRIGTDGEGIGYFGGSQIIDARGRIIISAGSDKETSVTGEISLNELLEFRKKFPVLNDADDFDINCD
jgi:omega-amidase